MSKLSQKTTYSDVDGDPKAGVTGSGFAGLQGIGITNGSVLSPGGCAWMAVRR